MKFTNLFFVFFTILTGSCLLAQTTVNMTLKDSYDDASIPRYNDTWGYIGPNGEEIAIIGSRDSILFFDISSPTNIVKLNAFAPGASTIWRDFKCYDNHCYAVADQGSEGLTIINMDSLLAGVVSYTQNSSNFQRAHNIWIDTAVGRLYACGTNTQGQGLIIYDLAPNPSSPAFLSSINLGPYTSCTNSYIHDLHVKNNIAYMNMVYNGCGFYIMDLSNPNAPFYLGHLPGSSFGNGLNHSCWVNDNNTVAVVCEETHGKPVYFVDITNPANMSILSTFKQPLISGNSNNIAHNPFIKGDLCYIAYYHDGVQVLNISNPSSPARVGYYDTYGNSGYSGYNGCWGVYPYFPSGMISASDISNGLHVLELNSAVLAADWVSFNAENYNGTEFHINGEFYLTNDLEELVVEWSDNGRNFYDLRSITASQKEEKYQFSNILKRPILDAIYVRMRVLESSGEESFSEVRLVPLDQENLGAVYPSVVTSVLNIYQDEANHCKIYNMEGKLILDLPLEQTITSVQKSVLPASGIYIVQLSKDDTNISTHKIVVE